MYERQYFIAAAKGGQFRFSCCREKSFDASRKNARKVLFSSAMRCFFRHVGILETEIYCLDVEGGKDVG